MASIGGAIRIEYVCEIGNFKGNGEIEWTEKMERIRGQEQMARKSGANPAELETIAIGDSNSYLELERACDGCSFWDEKRLGKAIQGLNEEYGKKDQSTLYANVRTITDNKGRPYLGILSCGPMSPF